MTFTNTLLKQLLLTWCSLVFIHIRSYIMPYQNMSKVFVSMVLLILCAREFGNWLHVFWGVGWWHAVILCRCWGWRTWSDGTEHRNVWPFSSRRSFVRVIAETEWLFQRDASYKLISARGISHTSWVSLANWLHCICFIVVAKVVSNLTSWPQTARDMVHDTVCWTLLNEINIKM